MGCNWAFKSPSYFVPVPKGKNLLASDTMVDVNPIQLTSPSNSASIRARSQSEGLRRWSKGPTQRIDDAI